MTTVGRKLLSAVLVNPDKSKYLKLKLYPELFKENEGELYEFIQDHLINHGELPTVDTVEAKLGDVLAEAKEPVSYYLQEVEKRYLFTKLKVAVLNSQEALKNDNADGAHTLLCDLVTELHQVRNRSKLFDFREAAELIHAEYKKQQKSHVDDDGTYFGWPTLDGMSAGLKGGDFVSINGRPSMGKTFMLLYSAHYGWRKSKSTPLFVSMEMNATLINQRLAAMDVHRPLTQLMKGTVSTAVYKKMLQLLHENQGMKHPFWVIDANMAATPEDILANCRQLRPTSVWIDGGYLLKNKNPRMGKFERIGENAEFIKQRIASDLDIPTIVSYQLNREAVKKNKKDKEAKQTPGLEDIYGNDAIGQLSSVALGLFQEESVETKIGRSIDIMKGRTGEVGRFKINWNFITMDFTEMLAEDKKELQYMG